MLQLDVLKNSIILIALVQSTLGYTAQVCSSLNYGRLLLNSNWTVANLTASLNNFVRPVNFKIIDSSLTHISLEPNLNADHPKLPSLNFETHEKNSTFNLSQIILQSNATNKFGNKKDSILANIVFEDNSTQHEIELVIIEFIFENEDSSNGLLQDYVFSIDNVEEEITIDMQAIFPEEIISFLAYNGSLSEPGCNGIITLLIDTEIRPLPNELSLWIKDLHTPLDTSRTLPYSKYQMGKVPDNIDHFFLFIMSIIIFFMQCGFAFMEAGAVKYTLEKSKNTVNILIKNWLDMCIGALVYWATGYAFTYGDKTNTFLSYSYFFGFGMPVYMLSKWFFNFVFAATAATLVSGALAERCNFIAYIVYSAMITGFIYPVIAHWAWHPMGWLKTRGFHDFAGSGVVHLCGGVCALVACILIGPRIGRFDKKGNLVPMPGHSVPLSAMGGFILIFGFFACNGAKQGSISNAEDGITVVRAIVNTALGTSAAGIFTLIFNKTGIVPGTGGNYSLLTTINGSLTGTIAMCAGCDIFELWAAVVIGALSGPLFLFSKWILLRLKIDDPLDAIPVHGSGGVWGLLAVHLFRPNGVITSGNMEALRQFEWNGIGLVSIITWTGLTSFIMFSVLKYFGLLRIDPELEFKGMDLTKHGEAAYPAEAWVEVQYGSNGAIRGRPSVVTISGLPPNMKNSGETVCYNNPEYIFPTSAALFTQLRGVSKDEGKDQTDRHRSSFHLDSWKHALTSRARKKSWLRNNMKQDSDEVNSTNDNSKSKTCNGSQRKAVLERRISAIPAIRIHPPSLESLYEDQENDEEIHGRF